jgi:hypothetical protein
MWLELVVTALVALALLAALQCFLLWRLGRQQRRLAAELSALALASGTDVPTSMLVTALSRMERQLDQLAAEPEDVPEEELSSYELARRLAREGAGLDELVARCGLSRHEAELVLRLQTAAQVA